MEDSIQAAFFTSQLVDQMLEVTQNGVATAWPDRNVKRRIFHNHQRHAADGSVAAGAGVLDGVAAAQNLLYIKDANGNFIGYTPLYAQFRRNRQAWADAMAAQATAYAQAMSDPVAGAAWPIVAQTYANKVTQALNDFNSMGRQQVQDALDTIATQGESAVTALAAMARQMYDAYQVQLAGGISANVPWSYISPISWWDYTDDSFGVQKITGTSDAHDPTDAIGRGLVRQQLAAATIVVDQRRRRLQRRPLQRVGERKPRRCVQCVRQPREPIQLDHAPGHSTSAIRDAGVFHRDHRTALVPRRSVQHQGMVSGRAARQEHQRRHHRQPDRRQDARDPADASEGLPHHPQRDDHVRRLGRFRRDASTRRCKPARGPDNRAPIRSRCREAICSVSASGQHQDQQSSGAFGSQQTSSGFTFTSDGRRGGTLQLLGSQIAGWIGQIQPAAPLVDDPTLPKPKSGEYAPGCGGRRRGCRATGDIDRHGRGRHPGLAWRKGDRPFRQRLRERNPSASLVFLPFALAARGTRHTMQDGTSWSIPRG